MLRGHLQGWPKKMGSTWLTRSLPLDHPAAAPLREGTRLGATLAVKDRRLVEARLELTGLPGEALGFVARPTYGTVGFPDLTRPERPPELRDVRSVVTRRVGDGWHEARAELSFMETPREELADLRLRGATRAPGAWASRSRARPRDRDAATPNGRIRWFSSTRMPGSSTMDRSQDRP